MLLLFFRSLVKEVGRPILLSRSIFGLTKASLENTIDNNASEIDSERLVSSVLSQQN